MGLFDKIFGRKKRLEHERQVRERMEKFSQAVREENERAQHESLLHNKRRDEAISEANVTDSILLDFCKAWQTLDADLIIKHLDDSFAYDSQWVLESLNRDDYANYIRSKFQALRYKNIFVDVCIVDDPYTPGNGMLKLIQGDNTCFYRIKILGNRVIKGDLCMF